MSATSVVKQQLKTRNDRKIESEARPPRIFVVDDDKLVLATLKSGLSDAGFLVEAFSHPMQALEAFQQMPPDLALLDIRMPELSGPDLARKMLQESFIPIIMLSAYDDREIVRESVQLGVSGYLVKPIMPNQLVPSIEAALARFAEVSAIAKNSEHLREGMESNRVISTAIGITMERANVNADVAFQRLRNLARKQRRPLREVASGLVEAVSETNSITGSGDPEN